MLNPGMNLAEVPTTLMYWSAHRGGGGAIRTTIELIKH